VLGGRAAHGLGLRGMRERLSAMGGHLTFHSAPGRGTKVSISIPVEGSDGDSSPPRG
jgi:signal transduction histidine kinase